MMASKFWGNSVSFRKLDLSLLRIRYAIEFMSENEQEDVVRLVELLADKISNAKGVNISTLLSLDDYIKPQRYDA